MLEYLVRFFHGCYFNSKNELKQTSLNLLEIEKR